MANREVPESSYDHRIDQAAHLFWNSRVLTDRVALMNSVCRYAPMLHWRHPSEQALPIRCYTEPFQRGLRAIGLVQCPASADPMPNPGQVSISVVLHIAYGPMDPIGSIRWSTETSVLLFLNPFHKCANATSVSPWVQMLDIFHRFFHLISPHHWV
jgi:hypothetical protein